MAPSPVEELALLDLERSNRGASKQRRDQINGEILTMRDLLPLPESSRQRLSQLQIMSLSCVYIRKCNIFHKLVQPSRCPADVPYDFAQALTGFILVTTRDGKLVYISENVTEYLGHSMVDMKTQGDSLFDIVDKRDHGTVQAQLLHGSPGSTADGQTDTTSFFCRMNMSKTLRRQGGFGDVKVMHVKGRFVPLPRQGNGSDQQVFIAIVSPLLTPDLKESLIQNNTTIFKSVHRLDMSFIEITESGEFHFGVTNDEICGKSWYSMLHPEDLGEAKAKHMQLIKSRHEMGCMMTVRMLTPTGDVIWVNTVMHVRQGLQGNGDDPVIICINQIVSDQEAKQFKIQGQLFALYAARAPDMFFSHHFPPLPPTIDPDMIAHTHAPVFIQPPPFYEEQQHFGSVGQPYMGPSQQQQPPHSHHQFAPDTPPDQFPPRPAGHTSTIKALKRKLQENFISSCRPPKLQRLVSAPDGSNGDGYMDNAGGGVGTQVLMNVNVFRNGADNMFVNGGDVQFFPSGPVAGMLHTVRQTPTILDHKHMLLRTAAPISTPDVVQKLPATCTLEQVVPEVKVPDCYLTPDPSPATSPKPMSIGNITTQDNQQIRHLTNFVTDRLNELQRMQTLPEVTPKPAVKEAKKKILPVIDAIFVDSFFDDLLSPPPETWAEVASIEETKVQIKTEPMSPPADVVSVSSCQEYKEMSPLPQIEPTPIERPSPIKLLEELAPPMSLDDCTEFQELFDLVENVAPDHRLSGNCCSSYDLQMSPISSPTHGEDMCSPLSSYASSSGSPNVPDHHKSSDSFVSSCSPGSTGSSSPGHDSRDDILDPDSWLLEPISMALDGIAFDPLAMVEEEPSKLVREDESLFYLKQLLHQQHPWAPCGADDHPDTQ